MKKTYKVIAWVVLGVAAAAVTGAVCEVRKRRRHYRLSHAAEEGYETAHDIIYPEKSSSKKDGKLRYGPVF